LVIAKGDAKHRPTNTGKGIDAPPSQIVCVFIRPASENGDNVVTCRRKLLYEPKSSERAAAGK
jgi:hypothetical protein